MLFVEYLVRLICALLCICSLPAIAETAICTGPVKTFAYHQPDGLYLAIGDSNIMKVCSPKELFFRTSPESCRLIASQALTPRSLGKSLIVYVDNASSTSCSQITNWFAADVRYVELLNY